MRNYVEMLKKAAVVIQELSKETSTWNHKIGQIKNDYDSACRQLEDKRKELAIIEIELKTRAMSFEQGLAKINEEANSRFREADQARRAASGELERAKSDRAVAAQMRQDAEGLKKQMSTVAQVTQKAKEPVTVGRDDATVRNANRVPVNNQRNRFDE